MSQSNNQRGSKFSLSPLKRIKIWYWLLLVVVAIFVVRLFYVQIIQFAYYSNRAQASQFKEYEIPANRGIIEAQNGDSTVPIVLNQELYTLFADPVYVDDAAAAASSIQNIIGGDKEEYEAKLNAEDTRYVVLAKKLSKEHKALLDNIEYKGIGTRSASYRTYPQGALAAQLLGFVNEEGSGTYGLEQALNDELSGVPGRVKAITDVQGTPLAGNDDNIAIDPEEGRRVALSIDIGMQQRLEEVLAKRVPSVLSSNGSALILEANTGKIKAMATYPTYHPERYYEVDDPGVFANGPAAEALEVGSIMKPLTLASALDQGLVNRDTTYFDPGRFTIGDATIRNVVEVAGSGNRSVADILRYSLNTGATWLLMQMGGGEINEKARLAWNDYMTNHYMFGQPTGIEQGFEASGYVPSPTDGFGLDIQYANTSFGQGIRVTPLQMAAALASAVNGGIYYQPQLVAGTYAGDGTFIPKESVIKNDQVVSSKVSEDLREIMQYAFENNFRAYGMTELPDGYSIGGKTGTAEVPNLESGGYYNDRYNGTFYGYVGGDSAEYVIIAYVKEPTVAGYAGTKAAGPIFADLATMLINDFEVNPKQD